MSSNYTFCGYDMLDPNSKAGRGGEDGGINLNSVTVQYSLRQKPELCRAIYEGLVQSVFGNGPTISDGGTCTIDELPTVCEFNEKGEMINVNPEELAQMASMIPTANFSGALHPMFHDNAQPTSVASPQMYNPYIQQQQQNPMMQPMGMQQQQAYCYPPNYVPYGVVPYNYNRVDPMKPIPNIQEAMKEWNDYQRRKGFRAPVPLDTDFPEYGLLSGFHQGFDPYDVDIKSDDFYDVTCGGRFGLAAVVHEQCLANAAMVWGWQPGTLIERKEQMMFPGVNNDHSDPTPSRTQVLNPDGTVQRRLTGSAMPPAMMANRLPISNMVATNPYMAGMTTVGGYQMQQPTPVPTPYMQARYNYAIHNGFQSVQEMDANDFRVLKKISRAAHNDMTNEEFEEFFDKNWCKRFTDLNELRENAKKAQTVAVEEEPIPPMKVTLKKGNKVLASIDCSDPVQYREHCANVRRCASVYQSPEQLNREREYHALARYNKDLICARLHAQAPERKYDDKSMLDFMAHGFVESFFYHLTEQERLNRMNPEYRLKAAGVDQTAFIKRCIECGLPAQKARMDLENKMFMVGETHPDPDIGDKTRGSWGMMANGQPLNLNHDPMFGYLSYIPDPENPDISIGFPRRFIEECYDGYVGFCNATNLKSSKPLIPMSYPEFEKMTGVRVFDNQTFLDKYVGLDGIDEYVGAAKRGIQAEKEREKEKEDLNRPIWADLKASMQDRMEFEDPHGDIPTDALLQDLEDDEDEDK